MLMLCGLSSALECDRARHYIVQSDRKVKCIDCRVCPPGYEPRVPCGKIIGANVSVGDCDPCKSGTYSPKKDFKACQDCQYKKCFDHQVVEGTCTDKNDMSRCTDKCEEGYIMNKRATACEVDLPLQNKTTTLATKTRSIPSTSPTTKTRSIPSTSPTTKTRSIRPSTSPTTKTRSIPSTSPTTKTRSNPSTSPTTKTRSIPSTSPTTNRHYRNTSHAQTDKESKLDSGVIAGIVIGVIVIVIIFIISICWYKSRSTEQGGRLLALFISSHSQLYPEFIKHLSKGLLIILVDLSVVIKNMKKVYKIILIFLKAKDDEELQGSTAELLDQPDEGEKGEAVKFSVQGTVLFLII